MRFISLLILALTTIFTLGQQIPTCSQQSNDLLPFSVTDNGTEYSTFLAVDANWRWVHEKTTTTNCYSGGWNSQCPTNTECTSKCCIDGIPKSQWAVPYGLSLPAKNAVRINYVTVGGTNIGNRLYLVNAQKSRYHLVYPLGKEIQFTVDVSNLHCGLNGALYMVTVDGANSQASFGTGYGDAQCPQDLRVIKGQFNTNTTGMCAPEIDLWEANKMATQFAPHTCSVLSATPCTTAKSCGNESFRYDALCDKDGADWNPYRNGKTSFYGPSSSYTIDTTKPLTVITRFHTFSNGSLSVIEQGYKVNGQYIHSFNQTDATIAAQKTKYGERNKFRELGGFAQLSKSMARGMKVVFSQWDDSFAHMKWLDSTYGGGAGAVRGPCPTTGSDPATLRAQHPNDYVVFSDFRVAPIGSAPSPSPTPTPEPTPQPTPQPSPVGECIPVYQKCGGQGYTGVTNCCVPKCTYMNEWYSQCL